MDHRLDQAIEAAVAQARATMRAGEGGPFGAAVIRDGSIVAVASNTVLHDHDATAHAEVNAIRKAGAVLGTHDLSGCVLYATGYPCPMCLSAIIWANINTVYYGCEAAAAEAIGFRDDMIYRFIEEGRSDSFVLDLHRKGEQEVQALYNEYSAENHQLY